LDLGDPLHVFGYPSAGGGGLIYTSGVVSGFRFDGGRRNPAWIISDVIIAAGSSGGTATDTAGRLVGVPTQASMIDCDPGDTNGDGETNADDTGCLSSGGSFTELRPINLAKPLLVDLDPAFFAPRTLQSEQRPAPTPASTRSTPAPIAGLHAAL
jgi:hypothetical protein